jgi:hypothetical protein
MHASKYGQTFTCVIQMGVYVHHENGTKYYRMLCNMETGAAIYAVIFPQFHTVTVLICGQLVCVCTDAAQFASVQTHPERVSTVTVSITEVICFQIFH